MKIVVSVLVAVAVGFLLAACSGDECPQPQHPPLSNQPLGGPCNTTNDCESGLTCLHAYDARIAAGKVCSSSCAQAACPSGTTCIQPRGTSPDGGAWEPVCVRTCENDEECRGSAAGVCRTGDGGTETYCQPIECFDEAQCPDGYLCEWSANACCPPGSYCVTYGLLPGYCRPAADFDGGVI